MVDIVQHLQEGLDFDAWYKEAETTGGSFAGSASLEWPNERVKALGMKLLLFRFGASKKLDIWQVGHKFIYAGSDINDNSRALIEQVFLPMASELRRHLEGELNKPIVKAPASDRTVSLDHSPAGWRRRAAPRVVYRTEGCRDRLAVIVICDCEHIHPNRFATSATIQSRSCK